MSSPSTPADPDVIRRRVQRLDGSASDSLQAAETLISKMSKGNEKESKKMAKRVVSAANQVVAVCEGVAEIHPVAKAVVVSFKAIIKLELDRRENNEQIAVICHSMNRLMHVLKFLADIVDDEDDLSQHFESELNDIKSTIEQFGEFAHVYYRYKQSTFRVCFSAKYKEELTSFFTTFNDHKRSMLELISYRVQLTTQVMHGQMGTLASDITKIIGMLGAANAKEQQAAAYIAQHGGPEHVVQNDRFLADIAKIFGDKINGPLKTAMREGLEQLLQENQVQFGLKVDGATLQITEEVEASRDAILRRLDAGPYELIRDEDVKAVWKEMQWRNSVKCRVFVDALHDRYELKFRESRLADGVPHPDQWTLKILSQVKYHAAIGDAIDKDGSGYMSTREVNEFLKGCPPNWTVPQWIAFWALGWLNNNVWYHDEAIDLLAALKDAAAAVKPENKENVDYYTLILGFAEPVVLDSLAEGAYENWEGDQGWDELDRLQSEYREMEMTKIRNNLDKAKFFLMDENMLVSVTQEKRIEVSITGLLVVLLQHHLEIVQRAQTQIIKEDVIIEMAGTLLMVYWSFNSRMEELLRGWKQQRRDVVLQINCFAGGLYSGLYKESQKQVSVITRLTKLWDEAEEEEAEDTDNATTTEEPDKVDKLVERVSALENQIATLEQLLRAVIDNGGRAGGPTPALVMPSATRALTQQQSQGGDADDDDGETNDHHVQGYGRDNDDDLTGGFRQGGNDDDERGSNIRGGDGDDDDGDADGGYNNDNDEDDGGDDGQGGGDDDDVNEEYSD